VRTKKRLALSEPSAVHDFLQEMTCGSGRCRSRLIVVIRGDHEGSRTHGNASNGCDGDERGVRAANDTVSKLSTDDLFIFSN
jgi:hypothetical protein